MLNVKWVVVISLLGSLITIFAFVTGVVSLGQLLRVGTTEGTGRKQTSVPATPEPKQPQTLSIPQIIEKQSTHDSAFHFQTWSYGGGQGVYIRLSSHEIQPDRIVLSFSVKSGDYQDLLLYAPRNMKKQFVENCEALYILDDKGQKFYSTTGWRGGHQTEFNSCTMAINFNPNEEVILTADFPMVSTGATSIKFVSPDPDNAGHQSAWYWQGINLKSSSSAVR